MIDCFRLITGHVPLLISMPHNGQQIPQEIASIMTDAAKQVPDTDWYIDQLYDFARQLGVYLLIPNYNRYVIDLNRAPNNENLYPGANSTELCPTSSFALTPLYLAEHQPNADEIAERIELYWQPYHQALATTLQKMKQQFGRAVLLDAHSILSEVPRFFEGQLPDFNFGSADGKSCSVELMNEIKTLNFEPYSSVFNGRFKGGYITRHYGDPAQQIHAIQLELSQRTYLHEPTNQYHQVAADKVKQKLQAFVQCLIKFAQQPANAQINDAG